jgi:hypothetical protein
MAQNTPAVLGPVESSVMPLPMPERLTLAQKVMEDMVRDALRYRWLRDEAKTDQWERAGHSMASETDAVIDAMMVCR